MLAVLGFFVFLIIGLVVVAAFLSALLSGAFFRDKDRKDKK